MTPTLINKTRGCEASVVVNTLKLQGNITLNQATGKLLTAQLNISVLETGSENYKYIGSYNSSRGSNLSLSDGNESYQTEALQDCLDLIAAVETDGLD